MYTLTALAVLLPAIASSARPNPNNSLSFTLGAVTCNPDLIEGACLYNHPITIGSIDARNYQLHSDDPQIAAKTSCPIKRKARCPKNDGSTQFNTTIAPTFGNGRGSSGPGQVFMNSHILQKLYVQANGLIAYSHPSTPNQIPKGAYANLWYLTPYTYGSCLGCSFSLTFNNTDENHFLLYTCKNPAPGSKGNLTYAAVPGVDVSKCTSFAALGGAFCSTQINGETCGNNA